jgi:hypothetical protein
MSPAYERARLSLEALEDRTLLSTVDDTSLFYKNSTKWNVTSGMVFSDDNAIAPDKNAYLPSTSAADFSAVSSYDKGINGLMVDLAGAHGPITASDFVFKMGNNNWPGAWVTANAPTAVVTRAGAGVGGSDRIEIMWDNGQSVKKQWLQVIVSGNDALGGLNVNTGLAASYVFYFGSAIGDTGLGNSGAFQVTSADEVNAHNNPKSIGNPATRDDINDFNRDGLVTSSDQVIAHNNVTTLATQLKFLQVSGGPYAPEPSATGSNEASSGTSTGGISSALTMTPREVAPSTNLPGWLSVRLTEQAGSLSTIHSAVVASSTVSTPTDAAEETDRELDWLLEADE